MQGQFVGELYFRHFIFLFKIWNITYFVWITVFIQCFLRRSILLFIFFFIRLCLFAFDVVDFLVKHFWFQVSDILGLIFLFAFLLWINLNLISIVLLFFVCFISLTLLFHSSIVKIGIFSIQFVFLFSYILLFISMSFGVNLIFILVQTK
jgi:hypothetical protein